MYEEKNGGRLNVNRLSSHSCWAKQDSLEPFELDRIMGSAMSSELFRMRRETNPGASPVERYLKEIKS